jgi:hypothetical protein
LAARLVPAGELLTGHRGVLRKRRCRKSAMRTYNAGITCRILRWWYQQPARPRPCPPGPRRPCPRNAAGPGRAGAMYWAAVRPCAVIGCRQLRRPLVNLTISRCQSSPSPCFAVGAYMRREQSRRLACLPSLNGQPLLLLLSRWREKPCRWSLIPLKSASRRPSTRVTSPVITSPFEYAFQFSRPSRSFYMMADSTDSPPAHQRIFSAVRNCSVS